MPRTGTASAQSRAAARLTHAAALAARFAVGVLRFAAGALRFAAGLAIAAALLVACAPDGPEGDRTREGERERGPHEDKHPDLERLAADFPRVDGSTSTEPLGALVECVVKGVPYRWEMPPGAERTVVPDAGLAGEPGRVRHHSGTHEAYVALIAGGADLALVARAPSPAELEQARAAGVALDAVPVARDALVFLANARNPLRGLTSAQARSVFGRPGERSWRALGGAEAPIEPFQREPESGSQQILEELVLKGTPARGTDEVPIAYTMRGPIMQVAMRPNAIAFSVFYYVRNMAPNPAVVTLAVDGVAPSEETIASGRYPLISPVYAVLRAGTRTDSGAARLRAWLLTPRGQAAIRESGYAPL